MSSSIELKVQNDLHQTAGSIASAQAVTCCPLCGSDQTYKKKLIELEPVIHLWQKFYEIDIRSEVQGFTHVELRRCKK